MLPRNALVICLLALSACDDGPEIVGRPERPAPERPMLEAGAYDVVVDDVAALACEGVSRRDLVGQHLPAELRLAGGRAELALAEWVLSGEMEPGFLFVEGVSAVEYDGDDEPPRDDPPRDEPRDDVDGDVDEPGASEPGASEEDCGEDVDCGEGEEGEEGEEVEPYEPERGYASLDARIRDERTADGRLTIDFGACHMELAVSLSPGGGEGRPPVEVEEDEAETADVPGSEG